MKLAFFILVLLFVSSFSLSAVEVNPEIEYKIYKQLRCLNCLGQDIADSKSEFSESIKSFVRKSLNESKSEEEIINQLVSLYGNQILQEPPIEENLFLWLLPAIILVIATIFFSKTLVK